MIQEIINKGHYKFTGSIKDLKKCIYNFEITQERSGEIQGITLLEIVGKFKYHGEKHKISVQKSMTDDNILFIQYLGRSNEKVKTN